MAVSLSANVRNRHKGRDNHTDREGPQTTHSRRSASVGTVGKHLFFDRVAAGTIATQDAPEIDAATPVGLRQSTKTWGSRFPAMLVGYMGSLHESALSVRHLGRSMNGLRAGMSAPPLMAAARVAAGVTSLTCQEPRFTGPLPNRRSRPEGDINSLSGPPHCDGDPRSLLTIIAASQVFSH
jgi:hypothetical protein